MNHTYAVIMAGGGGTRLWPISRKKNPKHILQLLGIRSLFQSTLDRLEGFLPPERIYVVTTADQELKLKNQAPQLPAGNFIIAPMPRGTASVVGLAAAMLLACDPQAVMLVLPADHFIRNSGVLLRVLRVAVQVAQKDYLVTIGITPTTPATGYGYIHRGAALPEKFDFPVHQVLRFTEKPDEAKAISMIAGGDYFWNSGIFIWRADQIMGEISRQMPMLKEAIDQIGEAWGTLEHSKVIKSIWPALKTETIDYGIMENATNVSVLTADGLGWSDVGSWDSLYEILPQDDDGNVVVNGEHMPIDTKNTLVYSSGKKLLVTIGMEDLIVIDSDDALLICHRHQTQQVREVIAKLNKLQREDFL